MRFLKFTKVKGGLKSFQFLFSAIFIPCIYANNTSCSKEKLVDSVADIDAAIHYNAQDQSFVKRSWQGIPSIQVLPNKLLVASWYTGGKTEEVGNYITLAESKDFGKTWKKNVIVVSPGKNKRVFDPCLWYNPKEKLLSLYFAQSTGQTWDGQGGVWHINRDKYTGKWSRPERLADGVMMNKPVIYKNNILLPVAYWDKLPLAVVAPPKDTSKVGVNIYSEKSDRASFIGRIRIPNHLIEAYEPQIVVLNDGKLWTLIRTSKGVFESISKDEGKSWSFPLPFTKVGPTTPSRFYVGRLKSGALILVLNNSVKRENLTAFISKDDGKTWPYRLQIDERIGVTYPDLTQDENGNIFIIYDHNRYTDKEILWVKITEDDIKNGIKPTINILDN